MKKKTNKWGTRKENWRLLVTLSQAGIPTNDFGSKDTLDELEAKIDLSFAKLKQIATKSKGGIQ